MNSAAIHENLDRIRDDLAGRGLSYEPLMEDLLDHVCCMVEDGMNEGRDFESSYGRALDVVGENSLPQIQHQTILNLDKKHQKMKNSTYIVGITSAALCIIGAFFKKMHWPGASIIIFVAILLIVGVFLPLYFISSQKEQVEKRSPVYPIVGYITLSLLLLGALFKIMHWPGAGVMLRVSTAFLIIGFVPLYVVNVFQRGGKEKVRLPYFIMVAVGISITILLTSVRMSKYAIDIYEREIVNAEQAIRATEERVALMMDEMSFTENADKREHITRIHERSASLQGMVDDLREMLLQSVDSPGESIQDVKKKDFRRRGWTDREIYDMETRFIQAAREMRIMLDEMLLDPVLRAQIDDHLSFVRKIWPYAFGEKMFLGEPFVVDYHMLTKISKGIALTEYVAIQYLLDH